MRLICDLTARNEVIHKRNIPIIHEQTVTLQGIRAVHSTDGMFYFEEAQASGDFLLVELADPSVWLLDKFQSPVFLAKRYVTIQGTVLADAAEESEKDCFIYIRRQDDCVLPEQSLPVPENPVQLSTCDLYLLIPGKLSKTKNAWDQVPGIHSQVFDAFQNNIDFVVKEEYNSDFAKSLERKCVAHVVLEIDDRTEKNTYRQNALVGIVKHETGFCILEFIIQNCAVGGTKILNYYCGDQLKVLYQGGSYSVDGFCELLKIRRFGRKRSMVFAYGDVPDQEVVNALANEEYPMGTIGGDFLHKVQTDNVAQYDTAEVYVSHETMFERCSIMDIDSDRRLSYHSVEIFFVELILLQDAAIDKIYIDLHKEGQLQRGYSDPVAATERYEQISFDMEQALRFSDYDQFNFPSVRKSAMKVSERFGVRYIYEKYETNKELLASMIATNKRRILEKQDKIKNQFLLLLSALAAVGTLGEILYVIHEDVLDGILSYLLALGIILCVFGVYKLVMLIAQWLYPRIFKKNKQ